MSGIVPARRTVADPDRRGHALLFSDPAVMIRSGGCKLRTPQGSGGLREAEEVSVKSVICLLMAAILTSGCVAGSNVTHEDSPAAVKRDEGPALCRDGTVPPCTP